MAYLVTDPLSMPWVVVKALRGLYRASQEITWNKV